MLQLLHSQKHQACADKLMVEVAKEMSNTLELLQTRKIVKNFVQKKLIAGIMITITQSQIKDATLLAEIQIKV